MGPYFPIAVLIACLTILFFSFSRSYYSGLLTSVFLLVFMPDSVAVNLGSTIPSLTIHRLTLVMLFIFWLRNRHLRRKRMPIPFLRFQIALLGGYAFSTLASLLSPGSYFLVGLKQYLDYVTGSFLLFVVFQSSLKDRLVVERVIRVLSLSLIAVAFFGYTERYFHFAISDILPRLRERYEFEAVFSDAGGRDIVSTYGHRILFGIACAIGLVTLLSHRYQIQKSGALAVHWVCIFFVGGALYFSNSRTPWVGFIAATIYMIVLVRRQLMKRALALVLIAGVGLGTRPGAWATVQGLFAATFDSQTVKGSSASWRSQIFDLALDKITNGDPVNFVFGYGGGSRAYMTFAPIELSTGHWASPRSWDSDYAIVLLERGSWGLVVTLAFYAYAGIKMSRYVLRTRDRDSSMIFALYSLCVIVVCRALVSFFAPQLSHIEAIVLAVGSRLIQTKGVFPEVVANSPRFLARRQVEQRV